MTPEYKALRADVDSQLRRWARDASMTLMREGRLRMSAVETDARRRVDAGKVDAAMESAGERASELLSLSSFCDAQGLTEAAKLATAHASAWAGISERFDGVLAEHAAHLESLADKTLSALEKHHAEWSAESIRDWVEAGKRFEARAQAIRSRIQPSDG